MNANTKNQSHIIVEAVITRANGEKENLGVIADSKKKTVKKFDFLRRK